MAYISVILCFFIFITLLIKNKIEKSNIFVNHEVIFVFIMTEMQFFSLFHWFDSLTCRDYIYFLCLLLVFGYVFGSAIAYHKKKYFISPYLFSTESSLNYSIINFFIIFSICITIPYALNIISTIQNKGIMEGLLMLRRGANDVENGVIYEGISSISNFLFFLFVEPMCYALPPLLAVDILNGHKNKILIIGTLILVLVKTLFAVNRATMVNTVVMIIMVCILNKKQIKLNSKEKIGLIFSMILLLLIAIFITVLRSFDNFSKQLYIYGVGALQNLEVRIDLIKESDVMGLGLASTYGFYNKFLSFIKTLVGFHYNDSYLELVQLLASVEDFKKIGNGLEMNAFVTPLYYLFIDGRTFGVFIGSVVYGYIVEKIRLKCIFIHSARSIALYTLLCLGCLFSMVRLQFANTAYSLGIIMIIIFTKKSRYKTFR